MSFYQGPKGWRALNAWGDGDLPAPWALGDVIDVPQDAPGVLDGRLYHGGQWKITAAFSISEGDEWYFRASPLRDDGTTDWDTISDRLHQLADYNALEGATLVSTTDAEGLTAREERLTTWSLRDQQAPHVAREARRLAQSLKDSGFPEEETAILRLAERLESSTVVGSAA